MGLFESTAVDPALTASIGSPEHRAVARQCVRESLVVLKNEDRALPLAKNLKRLAVVGAAADDLGVQCGGWTVDWQTKPGISLRGGTTILAAIRQTVSPESKVTFSADGSDFKNSDVVLVVVGEAPYAEGAGDRMQLDLPEKDAALIAKAKASGAPVVTILLSGRPLILGAALDDSRAFIAAWLPGSEGWGVADVLFGDFKPTGKLPRSWPASNAHLRSDDCDAKPLLKHGYGLTWK
jgi:beta-glucosidase